MNDENNNYRIRHNVSERYICHIMVTFRRVFCYVRL